MMQQLKKITKRFSVLLAVVSLLIIFKDVAFSLADNLIIPITSKVVTGSLAVLIFAILFVITAYLTSGFLIHKKNYVKHPEHTFCLAAIALVFYLLFRFDGHFVFYGLGHIIYVDVAFATAAILEVMTFFFPVKRTKGSKGDANVAGFMSDNSSKIDKLERTGYAELLLDKICMTYKSDCLADGSMTILLNERYGAGKTTFFGLLEKKAKGKIRTCVFKPWQSSDVGKITEELLRLLEEQYAISSQLGNQLESYSRLLAGSEVKKVLDYSSHLLKERGSLSKRYKSIKEMLRIINEPLVVLVDDVDRLQAEELLALLKLLRDAADFPNIVYIVAADKDTMSQMLEIKGIKDADEYLKKFFCFELLFPIDDSYLSRLLREQVENILTKYYGGRLSVPSIVEKFLAAHYIQNVFRSPRDIYRFVNLLSYSLDLFKRYGVLEEVHVPDLLKLLLIQFIAPMVYKILRDEMNLLLDVNGKDGRIHLKSGHKDIIISRQYKKQINEVISRANQKTNGRQDEPDNNVKEEDELTLFDIPAEERPNKEDIVSDLLRDLFYDTLNYQDKSRICFLGEYFKFFAGKYSESELSAQYMKELMGLQIEEAFVKRMDQAIEQGKADFLVHKLKQYIEDKTIKKEMPFVLTRCITIQDAIYRDWAKKQSLSISPIDYYQLDQFGVVYMNLLLVDKRNIVSDKQEVEGVKAFYATNKQYTWLASSLALPISVEHDMLFMYGQEVHLKLKENLIRRFIADELAENPFEIEKIKAIPLLKSMYGVYWDEHFKEYVKKSSDPMAWLYMLLKPSGDSLICNYLYYHNLVGEGTLDGYAKDLLGLELTQEIRGDLARLSGLRYGLSVTAANLRYYPFLVEAKKWWDAKMDKNLL